MKRGEIRLKNETLAAFPRYLVSRGLPLPAEWAVNCPEEVSIRDADGNEVPSAGTVLQRRADGSIEWMLDDFVLDFEPEEKQVVYIEHERNGNLTPENAVTVAEDDDAVTVANGITTLVINRRGKIIRSLTMHGREVVGEEDRVDLETVDPEGKIYRASVSEGYTVGVERVSRIRATVLVEGTHAARDGTTFLGFALRFTISAGRADVKVMHTFYVREPSRGLIEVKAVRFVMPTRTPPDARKLLRQKQHGIEWMPRPREVTENVEVVASSVSDISGYAQKYEPYKNGQLFLRSLSSLKENAGDYPFYWSLTGGTKFRAEYAAGGMRQLAPFIGWQSPELTLVFSMRYWAALHPKSVVLDENVLTVSIWPEWATPMQVVQGVSKSHTFWITGEPRALTVDEAAQKALQWEVQCQEPLGISIAPQWPAFCKVLDCDKTLRYQPERYPKLEERLGKVIPGEPPRFTYARNVPSGMFNFGDPGAGSFGNNEDDRRCYIPFQHYLRTGQASAFDFGEECTLHYMEVDHVEWSNQPRRHGGQIPHTYDHFLGEVYPSHQWAEGILAYYYLTGDERARKAVIQVADNHCYWIENIIEDVCCDGRESGIPLVNLAAAYRLTRNEKYIEAAWTIINNFHKKYYEMWGDLKYPYPHGAPLQWITGYGDYSSYYGLYRMWEVTGDEEIKKLLVALLDKFVHDPSRFSVDDSRGMDYFAVWAYIVLTGDDSVLETLNDQINNFLKKGGHEMRRLHFLAYLDERGDERLNLEGV
jgi:hypothetical protein